MNNHIENMFVKYNNCVGYEKEIYRLDLSRLSKIQKIFKKFQMSGRKGKILEVGCLSGDFLITLDKRDWVLYGVDLIDKKNIKTRKVNYIQHNIEKGLPFEDNFFDIIYAGEVIEHLHDTDFFIKETNRCLKKGGLLVLSTPNIASLINRFLLLFGFYPRYLEYSFRSGHIHLYNKSRICYQLKSHYFKIEKVKGNFLSIPDLTKSKVFRNSIWRFFGDLFPSLSENLIIVAKKINHEKKQESFYLSNKNYTEILKSRKLTDLSKYVKFLNRRHKILDYGCGTGLVVNLLSKYGVDAFGVDVSISSIKYAKKNFKGTYLIIKDNKLPFEDGFFDCVGSNNVIEHITNPEEAIKEMIRVLKVGGRIVVSCPNLLSVTSNYHPRLRGIKNKFKNFMKIIFKYLNISSNKMAFEKIEPILDEPFQSDYDAINLTNMLDLTRILKENKIKVVYMSGDSVGNKQIIINDLPFFRLFFGQVFVVGVKNE